MKKHFYLALLLLMAIGLGLLGCSEEDIFETTEAQEINGIISQFSPETFGKVVSGDYKVNWDVSAPLEHSEELGADYYEFEISLPENQIQITSKLYDIKQSLLAVKKENGQYDFYVAKYFMDRWKAEGYSVKDVSLSKMGSFSGLLNVFNNNNQMVYAKKMADGKVLSAPTLNSDFSNGNIETRMAEDCEASDITYHLVRSYKEVWNEEGTAFEYVYDFTFLKSISYDLTCYPSSFPNLDLENGVPGGTYYSSSGGGDYPECEDPRHGCIYEVETELVRFEDLIDDSKLKPCMKSIVSDLKGLNQGMGWVINRFNASGSNPTISSMLPNYNWTLEDNSLPAGQNGGTTPLFNTSTKAVTTIFDSGQLKNASDISIARTILHEALHAYLIVWDVNTRRNISQQFKEYPQLMSDYINSVDINTAQHGEFSRMIKEIADALQEFGNNRNYNLNRQFYDDLSWGGLTHIKNSNNQMVEAPWFLNAYPNISDRNRILNNISVESTGKNMNGVSTSKKGNNAGC